MLTKILMVITENVTLVTVLRNNNNSIDMKSCRMTMKMTTTMKKTIIMTLIIKLSLIRMMTKGRTMMMIMMVLAQCHDSLLILIKKLFENIRYELPKFSL